MVDLRGGEIHFEQADHLIDAHAALLRVLCLCRMHHQAEIRCLFRGKAEEGDEFLAQTRREPVRAIEHVEQCAGRSQAQSSRGVPAREVRVRAPAVADERLEKYPEVLVEEDGPGARVA